VTRTILWRRLDLPGHELARLAQRDDGWELRGTAVFAHGREPCELHYAVVCDAGWRTSSARVTGRIGERVVDLSIAVDGARRWACNGEEQPAVAGCDDIDLAFSPSTNLLPLRRLALAVGDEARVRAAWLPFPELELEPLEQLYRREGERVYRYESAGGSFERTLEVDDAGFVLDYPGLWHAETGEA
jgi:hypothetical protein